MTSYATAADLPGTSINSPYGQQRDPGINSTIDMQRAAISNASLAIEQQKLPAGFPVHLWEAQQRRYRHNWKWFTGEYLLEDRGTTKTGERIYRFPLRINPIKNFSRKHAALLFGEMQENSTRPLLQTKIAPKMFFDTPTEEAKKEARFYGRVVDEVWRQSKGDAMMLENGITSQFLGGSYFTLSYVPWRTDLAVPLTIKNPKPDFVMPIWSSEDYSLLECYIVYRIPAASAAIEYGYNADTQGILPWVTVAEHWDKDTHSIYIDGKPLVARYITSAGEVQSVSYNKAKNIFGFIPVWYTPRIREGDFYGSSIVDDIEGLVLELNGRLADTGTALKRTAHRKWFGRNIQGNPRLKQFDNEMWFTDLGNENPSAKHPPELWPEDPPTWSTTFNDFNDGLWAQLLREGSLTPVAFGEDEGSQRSAMTLAIRFWPTTVLARKQRINWTQTYSEMAAKILQACAILKIKVGGRMIPLDLSREFNISVDWLPMVPRDREQTVNEVVLLSQAQRMSMERALELLGDITDVNDEMKRIYMDIEQQLDIQAEHAGNVADATAASGGDASTKVQSPTASDGLDEE